MRHDAPFTRADAVVLIAIAAGVIVLAFPVLASLKVNARRFSNDLTVSQIQFAFSAYGAGNKGYYPGLTSSGELADALPTVPGQAYGAARNIGSLSMATILNNAVLGPSFVLISRNETNPSIAPATPVTTITPMHYSFAVSKAEDHVADAGRLAQWRENSNPGAVVVTDRLLDAGAEISPGAIVPPNRQRSIWTTRDGDWQGSVAYNDGSAEFLKTGVRTPTNYGAPNPSDELFTASGPADAMQIRN